MADNMKGYRVSGSERVQPKPVTSQKSRDEAARRDACRFRETLEQVDRASDREIDRSLRRVF